MGGELGNGTMSKMTLMVAYHEKYLCWAEQEGIDNPRVKNPVVVVRHDHRR